jgi:hypothetical protein
VMYNPDGTKYKIDERSVDEVFGRFLRRVAGYVLDTCSMVP